VITAESDGDSALDESNISSAQQILNQGAGIPTYIAIPDRCKKNVDVKIYGKTVTVPAIRFLKICIMARHQSPST